MSTESIINLISTYARSSHRESWNMSNQVAHSMLSKPVPPRRRQPDGPIWSRDNLMVFFFSCLPSERLFHRPSSNCRPPFSFTILYFITGLPFNCTQGREDHFLSFFILFCCTCLTFSVGEFYCIASFFTPFTTKVHSQLFYIDYNIRLSMLC